MSALTELHRRSTLSEDVEDKYHRQRTADLLAEFLQEYRAAHHQPKAEPAPKPKPTGIKPRGCILPVLVVLLLAVPLLGLCLPVFIVGGQQSNQDKEQFEFICLLYPLNSLSAASSTSNASSLLSRINATYINSPVLQAWVAWADAEEDALADADNATALAAAEAAERRLLARQERFFAALRRNCSTVASVLWGLENSHTAASLFDSPAWQYWLELNRQPWSPDQLPPAPPLPPTAAPPPPDPIAAQQAAGLPGGSGSSGSWGEGAAAVATQQAVGTAAAAEPDYEDYGSAATPGTARPRPSLYGIAAYVLINATLISMDVVAGLAKQNFEVHLGSLNPWAAARARAAARAGGWLLDEHGRLQPDGVRVHLDVVTATGSGLVTLNTGDRVGFKQMDIIVDVIKSSYFYPYDQYRAVVKMMAYVGNDTYHYPIAVLLNQRNVAVGWSQEVETLPDVQENYVLWWSGSSDNQEGEVHLTYAVVIQRSVFTKLFCFLILIGMWVLSGCAASYAVDMVLLRPRNAVIVDVTLFATLLFAMPNIRNVMPGVPAIGVGIDLFGFIWIMLLCILSGSMVLARLVAQYVHPSPTLYDKAVKNEVYLEWKKKEQEKKDKKEAKDKKDKEEREREQQANAAAAGEGGGGDCGKGAAAAGEHV